MRWFLWPFAIYGPGYALIAAWVGWLRSRNKRGGRVSEEASRAVEETGAALPGWDGATIQQFFVDESDGIRL